MLIEYLFEKFPDSDRGGEICIGGLTSQTLKAGANVGIFFIWGQIIYKYKYKVKI